MKFIPLPIPDLVLIEPDVKEDSRGYFAETFRLDKLEAFLGKRINFIQDNESRSKKGVLRGLHFQLPPQAQSKLVRVVEGTVLDVVVDLRYGSPTYGKHYAVELSGENKRQLFIPRGFAHGFLVLSDFALFSYKVDNYYSPKHDTGILFNDNTLKIDWRLPENELIVSEKDFNQPKFNSETVYFNYNLNYYV